MGLHIRPKPNIPLFARHISNSKVPDELRRGKTMQQLYLPDSLKYAMYQIADAWGTSRTMYMTYLIIEGICRDAGLNTPEALTPRVETDTFLSKQQAAELADRLRGVAANHSGERDGASGPVHSQASAGSTPAPAPAPVALAPHAPKSQPARGSPRMCKHNKDLRYGCISCANEARDSGSLPDSKPADIDPLSVL